MIGAALPANAIPADFELPGAMGAADDFDAAARTSPGTAIFAPDGTVVAEASAGEETIVYGDLDLGRIAEEQQALDVAGHYNRPDVFELRIDETPRQPIAGADRAATACRRSSQTPSRALALSQPAGVAR